MESLRKVCLSIRSLMPKIVMHHLVSAIRLGRFTESLIRRLAKDLDELRNQTTKFMQIEKLTDYHISTRLENGGHKGREKDGGNQPISGRSSRNRDRRPQFFNYTPLNVSRGKILKKTLQDYLISVPKQSH